MDNNPSLCAIAIPIYKTQLSHYEQISLRRTFQVFDGRDIFIVAPHHLRGKIDVDGAVDWMPNGSAKYLWFDDHFFKGVRSYNRLMLDAEFYERFLPYEYVLIVQTDAYVFDDRIEEFVAKGVDYIGAPWFDKLDRCDENSALLEYSGNGGFSLRRIKPFLQILLHKNAQAEPVRFYMERIKSSSAKALVFRICENAYNYVFCNKVGSFWKSTINYEDYFWARCAGVVLPGFVSGAPNISMDFSFECNPRKLFEMSGRKLPMGCHGWWKYDLEFWKDFIPCDV